MATRRALGASIAPFEVLFPDARIEIDSPQSIDLESAQSGISVLGERGAVRLSRSGQRVIWSPENGLRPGLHTVTVEELYTSKRKPIEAHLSIPFFVTDSRATVPSTLRIESMVRLRLLRSRLVRVPTDRRPRGRFIELMKTTHRKTGTPKELAFDQDGRPFDLNRFLKSIAQRNRKKFGKIHPELAARLPRARHSERIDVAAWLRFEDPPQDEIKHKTYREGSIPTEVRSYWSRMDELTQGFAKQISEMYRTPEIRTDPLAPVVYAKLTKREIRALAGRDDVIGVYLHEPEGIDDLDDSIAIANSDAVHTLGFDGTGIKVAVWESGPDDTSELDIEAFYDPAQSSTSDHARHTHGIIKNVEEDKPHGHAPDCSLYSANDKDLDALAWAVREKGCTVISQSFHRPSEPGSSALSYDDIYKDWLVLHWPYPTILQAAGNYWDDDPDNIDPPSTEYVNHKGYNSLAVGNHNDTAASMSGSSVFRNPSTSHYDRELPEICANGTSVEAVGLTKSGTSMAAPAAAGATTLIQDVNPVLKTWPEGCRAILLAGAQKNVDGDTWWKDVLADTDASDGSGAVDAYESTRITQSRRTRNAAGTRRGWDIGTLNSSDFDSKGLSEFSYKVTVPKGLYFLGPRHVKVALAWNSKISSFSFPFIDLEIPLSSNLALDLDLKVFDSGGNLIGYSGSWDNSYEIAEFDGVPGETYTIRIRRWSGTDSTWYGIAWTVTGGFLLPELVLRKGLRLADLNL